MALKLTVYDIIKGPVLTDKAYELHKAQKTISLLVHPQANKPMVAEAIEKLFKVKVDKVRIVVRKGKLKRVRMSRLTTQGPLQKKALVTLAKGYSLDMVGQGVGHEQAVVETEQVKGE